MSGISLKRTVIQQFQRMLRALCADFMPHKTDLHTKIIHTTNRKNSMINGFHPCTLSNLKHETSHFKKLRVGSLCAEPPPPKTFPRHWFRLVIVRGNARCKLHKVSDSYSILRKTFPLIPICFGFTWHRLLHGDSEWQISRNPLRMEKVHPYRRAITN